MSERRDSTCQKHELPKSLQGTEDAEFVWSMITDRFPNAAPLLCEMETVIDRAEDLLQQLRAPYREIETSTSFFTQDSEDTTVMISARESLITENDTVEESDVSKNVAEIQVSESSIDEENLDQNQNSIIREQNTGSQFSDSLMNSSIAQEFSNDKSASLNITNTNQLIKEAHSLEEWGKIADNAMEKNSGTNNRYEIISFISLSLSSFQPRYNLLKKQLICLKSEPILKEISKFNIFLEHEDSCIILHRQEISVDVGDSVMEINSDRNMTSQKLINTKNDTMNVLIQGSGDESSSKISNPRTPLSILEMYAKRCKIPVEYEYTSDYSHSHKSNVYIIRGNFAGFVATCRGLTEESTKNDLASKILQMIANQQMKDEKLTTLADLAEEEYVTLIEIISLGMDGLRETAQRKLYQLCLEKEIPVPKYSVEKIKTYQGLTYVATCSALGYITEGRGVRECVAKKAAADELYHQYCEGQKAGLKVSFLNSPIS
ncbi:hypothetical protein E2986_04389 [Frieseomelitta varia]|uniref:DRBM domain-containing protein n=1 Tax=Frieseomelitta varia TaxID=561572 RepID=A0A833SBW4_9HYME|nr:hypothetical protein E2986_04389 [Frieseomelitta varia]